MIVDTYNSHVQCPSILVEAISPPHAAVIDILDQMDMSNQTDDNGNFVDPAVADRYQRVEDLRQMRLYREQTLIRADGSQYWVTSWYWLCPICGLVLPATGTRVER